MTPDTAPPASPVSDGSGRLGLNETVIVRRYGVPAVFEEVHEIPCTRPFPQVPCRSRFTPVLVPRIGVMGCYSLTMALVKAIRLFWLESPHCEVFNLTDLLDLPDPEPGLFIPQTRPAYDLPILVELRTACPLDPVLRLPKDFK